MYTFNAERFANDLSTARGDLSFRQAARRVGVSHTTLCDIENRRKQPTVRTLLTICAAFGLSPVSYFADDNTALPPGAWALDYDALHAALADKRATVPHCKWRAHMADSGVSHVAVWRLKPPYSSLYLATLSTICEWLDTPPGAFLVEAS